MNYAVRDNIEVVVVKQIKQLKVSTKDKEIGKPSKRFIISSKSNPQYMPYLKTISGLKNHKKMKQTRYEHFYDITLELEDSMTINSNFKIRVGSLKKWNPDPPQEEIRTIYKRNLKDWTKEEIEKHKKKRRLYLDVGDWNSRKNGINGDFYFRLMPIYYANNMLIGRCWETKELEGIPMPFFDKHTYNFVKRLIKSRIIKLR